MDFNNSKRVLLGLSTSCSRVSKKFPVVPQNVGQKLLFATEVAQTLLEKAKLPFVCKYANCTTKVRFLSIFVQFSGVTSVAK